MAVRERIDVTMDAREIIREMYRKYWRYMIAKDADGLRSLMAKDYYLMHMTGVKQPAEVFLRGCWTGRSITIPLNTTTLRWKLTASGRR